jgi:hypothetical protein
MMAFDRRSKSFGEPTRVRTDGTRVDSSANNNANNNDVPRPRAANTAYERYKQELAAFFNGQKPLPEHMRDLLSTRPGAAEHGFSSDGTDDGAAPSVERENDKDADKKETDKRAPRRVVNGPTDDVLALQEAIRRANSPREVDAAVKALRDKGASLPKDAEILSKALGSGDEDVLTEALRGLLEIEMKDIKSPTLLKTRVKNVSLLSSSAELRELCGDMQKRLG